MKQEVCISPFIIKLAAKWKIKFEQTTHFKEWYWKCPPSAFKRPHCDARVRARPRALFLKVCAQILYRWCLAIKPRPSDCDRSNFLEMVTGSKGNKNMMLVMEWVVDFVMDFVMVKVVIKGVEE